MLICQGVTYTHPNRHTLFTDINFSINGQDKVALIGNNGAGKSTLLKLLAGELHPAKGSIKASSKPYYLSQAFGQYNVVTVARALGIEAKLQALKAILGGELTETNTTLLEDDWAIEERCREAFDHWGLEDVNLDAPMGTLSGGQQTRVFLAGILVHQPGIVLLDEPSNHLDAKARDKLYQYIYNTRQTLVVVSHDRTLLNLLGMVYELGRNGITAYGGDYEFYVQQKQLETDALQQNVRDQEKALRKAKETQRQTLEQQQKLNARGKTKKEKEGAPAAMMKILLNNAEKSTARLKGAHTKKITGLTEKLDTLRKELPGKEKMRLEFEGAVLHIGKRLVRLKNVNFAYATPLWEEPLNLDILSGDRLSIQGPNGSGKTTLIKMILGERRPTMGAIEIAASRVIYLDQDFSLLDNYCTVYEQAQAHNTGNLQEHEVKNRLTRFLFSKDYWDRPCKVLSGGERMRLTLCCLNIGTQAPDMLILDEPTNNLDIQNTQVLSAALNEYLGTLVIVSHDTYFLREVGVTRTIELSPGASQVSQS